MTNRQEIASQYRSTSSSFRKLLVALTNGNYRSHEDLITTIFGNAGFNTRLPGRYKTCAIIRYLSSVLDLAFWASGTISIHLVQ